MAKDIKCIRKKDIEEILELVWMKKEDGFSKKEDLISNEEPLVTIEIIDQMVQQGYLVEKDGKIDFSEKGKADAVQLIRAHRLAERLFVDVLDMKEESIETDACTFEHILSPEIITRICTLLGHPKECPHGRPIPQGDCCRQSAKKIESIVLPLSDLKVGEEAKIMYVATKHHARLDQLMALGVSPGREAKLHQKMPSYVVQVGETDIALDEDILKDIFVRRK